MSLRYYVIAIRWDKCTSRLCGPFDTCDMALAMRPLVEAKAAEVDPMALMYRYGVTCYGAEGPVFHGVLNEHFGMEVDNP